MKLSSPWWKAIGFLYKSIYQNMQAEKGIFVMLCIARDEEFQFVYLTKTVLKTTSNVILYIKKVDLDEY